MPLYRFIINDGRLPADDSFLELEHNVTAYFKAIKIAGQALNDNPARIARRGTWSIEVNDNCGNLIYNIEIFAKEMGLDLVSASEKSEPSS